MAIPLLRRDVLQMVLIWAGVIAAQCLRNQNSRLALDKVEIARMLQQLVFDHVV